MKKVLLSLMVAGLLLAFLAVSAVAAPGGVTNPDTLKELAQARQGTMQLQNAELPAWDGTAGLYVQVSPRVPGMGYHYANFALVDGVFNPAAPEIVLYEDAGNGRRLVAVEYIVITGAGPPSGFTGSDDVWTPPAPGAPLPPGTWTLHAWVWEGNPAGIFAPFNPNIP